MSTATLSAIADAGPLSRENHREMAVASERVKKIYKAARVAAANGWITAIVAACSAPFALLDATSFLMTACLALVAWNEFRGRKGLRQFDPSAATLLGFNQLGLMVLISVYCLWMIYSGLTQPNPFTKELADQPELRQALASLGDVEGMYRSVVVLIYGTVILLTVVFQGLNAVYYFTRRGVVERYVRETPEWVLDVQRAHNA